MCLILTVTVRQADRAAIDTVARQFGHGTLHIEIEHPPRWRWAQAGPLRAFISERGGCACSVLTDDADWNAEAWAMRPEILEPLAATIEHLIHAVPDGLTIEALWAGDAPKATVTMGAEEFASLVRTSRIGTKIRYEVRALPELVSPPDAH